MVKIEICKLFKMKIVILPILIVFGVVVYSLFSYGEFGYDFSDSMTAYSEMDGRMISGQAGYEHNKKIAALYEGEVTDSLLERINKDYLSSTYASVNGIKFYNSTLRFFHDIFQTGEEHYLKRDDVWSKNTGAVKYGFTGDWDAYIHIIRDFFRIFTLFILVFAAPLFPYEKECSMVETIGTVRYGGNFLYRYKVRAVFIVVNTFLLSMITLISVLHFSRCGFTGGDVSIQCSMEKTMVRSAVSCSMAQLAGYKLVFGIIGCNMILGLTVFCSMLSSSSLTALGAAAVSTWLFHYAIVHGLIKNAALDIFLALFPINALEIESLINAAPSVGVLYAVQLIQLILSAGGAILMKKIWETKRFYR